ncbi:MAG: HlyC/CorC family transporter [Ruminococcaceae bacterium]|nr:HlyC/CorC family transporter [Oscillospiraceae bacterium]
MDVLPQLMLQLLLILLNAFFAATEIAFVSLNENKLKFQAEEGDKKAKKMLKIVQEPTGFLSTIQIGITLAGFLGSAFAAEGFSDGLVKWMMDVFDLGPDMAATLDAVSVIVITLILSYFTLVLGELVPKRIAMKKPEKFARVVCGFIMGLSKVLKPIVWFMTVSTNGVLRLCGINPKEQEETISEDDIRLMIDLGEERGTIDADEKEMIENIFEFGDTSVSEVMVHRTSVTFIDKNSTPDEILDIIKTSGYSRFPVIDENADNVIGILIARVFLMEKLKNPSPDITKLIKPAKFVHESVRADVLFKDMQKNHSQMCVVVDEFGGTSGIVTLEDLLEEIVGNIYDESDTQNKPDITKLGDNIWRIAGTTQIDDICDMLDIDIDYENEEYKTLGGLIFSVLPSIPDDGTTPEIELKGLKIKVEKIVDLRVQSAIVSKIITETETEEENDD